jgi:hypothetical protein
MRGCWDLPATDALFSNNPHWFLHTLQTLEVTQRAMLLMLLWRVWHVHNELTHQKKVAPVESSKRFLMSYLESLMSIRQHGDVDVEKGKQVVSCVQGFSKDSTGAVIFTACRQFQDCRDALESELVAIEEGLALDKEPNHRRAMQGGFL